MKINTYLIFLVMMLGLLTTVFSYATSNFYSTDTIRLVIEQPQVNKLKCSYRFIETIPINHIEAKLGGIVLPILNEASYQETTAQSAILFLIEISDQRRHLIIKKNIQQIKQLLEKKQPYHKFGLASFATELQILAPLGTNPTEIATKTDELHASGQTTELYRHTLESINLLKNYPAQWRALFIFSDGNAEDSIQAYSLNNVL